MPQPGSIIWTAAVFLVLLFVLPMITMRTYAEEKRSGTMELLTTLPVRDYEIVVGNSITRDRGSFKITKTTSNPDGATLPTFTGTYDCGTGYTGTPSIVIAPPPYPPEQAAVHQYAGDYTQFAGDHDLTIDFAGSTKAPMIDAQPHSGLFKALERLHLYRALRSLTGRGVAPATRRSTRSSRRRRR